MVNQAPKMDSCSVVPSTTPSMVVSIECITGSRKAEEWGVIGESAALQSGDIVEVLTFGSSPPVRAPFKGGRAGVMKLLHSAFKRNDTSILVKTRRLTGAIGESLTVEFQACIVPMPAAGRRQYVLRSIRDPNYAVAMVDRSEVDCIALQGSRSSRVVCALSNAQLQDGYVSYNWDKKMKLNLVMTNSSCFLSILMLPKASDASGTRYNDLEDTLARANAWLNSSQASGVPIAFINVQTEALLTKISGETASSTVNMGSLSDLTKMANVSLYGFEDYHGVDIGVVRAVRLWYTPTCGEMALEIKLQEGDSKLGFAISRTEEGFIYISSVADDNSSGVAATRSGLIELHKEASKQSKLLVVSRVGNEKVLPWMVATSGAIRCFDTVSLSQKLSLHRHALRPILLHLLMWDSSVASNIAQIVQQNEPPTISAAPTSTTTPRLLRTMSLTDRDDQTDQDDVLAVVQSRPQPTFSPPPTFTPPSPVDEVLQDLVYNNNGSSSSASSDSSLGRDTAGDLSFRFHNFSIIKDNWV